MSVEGLVVDKGSRLCSGASRLCVVEELCCRVFLQELFALDLEEVGTAHFLITASMLILDCSSFMCLHNISLGCLDAFLEQSLSLSCLPLPLVINRSGPQMFTLESLKVTFHFLDFRNVIHEVFLLLLRQK